jgi:tetratricopeptide (TPR) repeat protein
MHRHACFVLVCFLLSFSAGAAPLQVDAKNSLRINYRSKEWNTSSSQVDGAVIVMREGASGRLVQIDLTETAPDSSEFSGLYSITWQNIQSLQIEFYIPPQDLMKKPDALKTLGAMIQSKELKRKPFLLHKNIGGQQLVEVFDTREEAQEALKTFQAEKQALLMKDQKPQNLLSNQEVDTANIAADLQVQKMAAANAAERFKLNEAESQHRQDMKNKFSSLSTAQKTQAKKQAEKTAADAMALFQHEKFDESRTAFQKAADLNPESPSFLFQEGASLYKMDRFNQSIVLLNLADGPSVRGVEKAYFMGLDFFRLKEYNSALKSLDAVIAYKDPALTPAAKFYKGIVYFEAKHWDDAQKAFQMVLDESQDKKLDETAEAYINQILRIRQFEAERAKKWLLTATLGEQYDSNVLLQSDSSRDTGTATNTEGWRSLFLGSFRYRPTYEEDHEFAVQLDTVTMYSVDKDLKGDQTLRNADPTVLTLTLPYTRKGTLFGKGHKLDITPGYEDILMSVEDNTTKVIIQSYTLGISNLFIMKDNWFANYNLELRQDNSKLASSTGDADSTALKMKLTNGNIFLVSDDKSKIVTADIAYTLNQANGINSTYNRYDLAVGYILPTYWETSTNLKLGYFNQAYPQLVGGRTDNSYTLTTGFSKKINDIWSSGFLGSYNINDSTVDANQYKKWTALLTLSASVGF